MEDSPGVLTDSDSVCVSFRRQVESPRAPDALEAAFLHQAYQTLLHVRRLAPLVADAAAAAATFRPPELPRPHRKGAGTELAFGGPGLRFPAPGSGLARRLRAARCRTRLGSRLRGAA